MPGAKPPLPKRLHGVVLRDSLFFNLRLGEFCDSFWVRHVSEIYTSCNDTGKQIPVYVSYLHLSLPSVQIQALFCPECSHAEPSVSSYSA
jgi:hypothetical protein